MIPVYKSPVVIHDFITDEEIEHIKTEAKKTFKTSTISSSPAIDESIRKSETAWLELTDPIVNDVMQRCVSLTDRPLVNCEKLQVLRYGEGGFYKPHQDTFSDTDTDKRMYTVILALNDEYEGGETIFPNINKSYKLRKGDALFFHTLDNYELMTSKALHGGSPIKTGEKWICNVWIHKHPYKG